MGLVFFCGSTRRRIKPEFIIIIMGCFHSTSASETSTSSSSKRVTKYERGSVLKPVFPHRLEKDFITRLSELKRIRSLLPVGDSEAVLRRREKMFVAFGTHKPSAGQPSNTVVKELTLSEVDRGLRNAPVYLDRLTNNVSSIVVRAFNAAKISLNRIDEWHSIGGAAEMITPEEFHIMLRYVGAFLVCLCLFDETIECTDLREVFDDDDREPSLVDDDEFERRSEGAPSLNGSRSPQPPSDELGDKSLQHKTPLGQRNVTGSGMCVSDRWISDTVVPFLEEYVTSRKGSCWLLSVFNIEKAVQQLTPLKEVFASIHKELSLASSGPPPAQGECLTHGGAKGTRNMRCVLAEELSDFVARSQVSP